MVESEFLEINKIFNNIITQNDLEDNWYLVDNQSILSRIYKKIDGKIENKLLGLILLFNAHINKEEYILAQKVKDYCLIFKKIILY